MKKISKILSSILAVSMVISCCAISAFAGTVHTATITVKDAEGNAVTTGLKAGDVVTVEVSIDNTSGINSCGYQLNYDNTVFTADTTKVSRLEKCIDSAWMSDIKDTEGDWAYYLNAPTYKVNTDIGYFNFQWAGTSGVEAEYAVANRVIGKFYLTVKDGVADGTEATFELVDATTGSDNENDSPAMNVAPVKVTVGSGSTDPDPELPVTTENYFAANVKVDDKPTLANTLVYWLTTDDATKEVKTKAFELPLGVDFTEGATIKTAIKITDIPADVTVTCDKVEWK